MKRREFIAALGGAAVGWPLAARAQQHPGKRPTIGVLDPTSPSTQGPTFAGAFASRLRELGWLDGRNVTVDFRYAEGRGERYAEIAGEFVRAKVDIIVVYAVPARPRRRSDRIMLLFCCGANCRYWHKADIPRDLLFGRFRAKADNRPTKGGPSARNPTNGYVVNSRSSFGKTSWKGKD